MCLNKLEIINLSKTIKSVEASIGVWL